MQRTPTGDAPGAFIGATDPRGPNGHVMVDALLVKDGRIGPYELAVYVALVFYGVTAEVDAPVPKELIATTVRVSPRTVHNALGVLQRAGYLRVSLVPGGASLYRMVAPDPATERHVSASVPTRQQPDPGREVREEVAALTERDGSRCHYCLVRLGSAIGRSATVDHKEPRSAGGSEALANKVLACGPCNRRKGTTPHDAFCAVCRCRDAVG